MKSNNLPRPKIANEDEFGELKKLSTENLIIWNAGKSLENRIRPSIEDIALEVGL